MTLLILAVSLQVVPMFHVAPSFPLVASRIIPLLLFLSLAAMLAFPLVVSSLLNVTLIALLLFNLVLLKTIWRRKRRIPDITIDYWRLAVASFITLVVFYFSPDSWLTTQIVINKEVLLTAVFIYLYLISIIQGMLLKILPFLSYTHLQQRCMLNFDAMQFLPKMHELSSKKMAKVLFLFPLNYRKLYVTYSFKLTIFLVFSPLFTLRIYSIFNYFGEDLPSLLSKFVKNKNARGFITIKYIINLVS